MGDKIGQGAIATGSSSTSAAYTAIGTVEILHGMGTTPTIAYAQPLAPTTSQAVARSVGLVAAPGRTYITFITASAPCGSNILAVDTMVGSALSSAVTMTFVWLAISA